MNCVFCRIVEGSEKAELLYENESALAILDINPVNYGHSLVISKKHYESLLELPESEYADILEALKTVSEAIMSGVEPKPGGFNIILNNGFPAGQRIFHLHFHIIPRYSNDGLKFKPQLKRYSKEEFKKYADLIRSKIKNFTEVKNDIQEVNTTFGGRKDQN